VKVCSVHGCTNEHGAKGMCPMHYQRMKKHGTTDKHEKQIRVCSVEGCGGKPRMHGMCIKHYQRWAHHGSTDDPRPTVEARFWSKVKKADGDSCWEWTGARQKNGYGSFRLGDSNTSAHRASYIINVGPVSADIFVCHKCDNPPCVRPDHLFLGTAEENNHDREQKGRSPDTHKAVPKKLTRQQVEEIKSMRSSTGWSYVKIGQRFGVSKTNVGLILQGKIWTEATP
jgi:hypothetical protein